MADERNYYVICEDNCLFPAMTYEQVLEAIAEATGETPQHVEDAFITKIKEQNAGGTLKIWKGTEAQYNAIQTKDSNTLYLIDTNTVRNVADIVTQTQLNNMLENYWRKYDVVDVNGGGTGAKTPANARANLGAAAANHTHTLTDLNGTLSVAKGGTGSTTAAAARTALGAAASDHTHTPASIGAASTEHTHGLNSLIGQLSVEHGGTGAASTRDAKRNLQIDEGHVDGVTTTQKWVGFNFNFTSIPRVVASYNTDVSGTLPVLKVKGVSIQGFYIFQGGSDSKEAAVDWIAIGSTT